MLCFRLLQGGDAGLSLLWERGNTPNPSLRQVGHLHRLSDRHVGSVVDTDRGLG